MDADWEASTSVEKPDGILELCDLLIETTELIDTLLHIYKKKCQDSHNYLKMLDSAFEESKRRLCMAVFLHVDNRAKCYQDFRPDAETLKAEYRKLEPKIKTLQDLFPVTLHELLQCVDQARKLVQSLDVGGKMEDEEDKVEDKEEENDEEDEDEEDAEEEDVEDEDVHGDDEVEEEEDYQMSGLTNGA